MSDEAWRATVRRRVDVLLADEAYPGPRRDAAIGLFELLAEEIGLGDDAPTSEDDREISLPEGVAISPRDAARCVRDVVRTRMFVAGTGAAVEAARRHFPNEAIRVLYAGCGPFATLALPIAHRWEPDAVRLTLLDCHERSLEAARRLATRLGVIDRIDGFVPADATRYVCPGDRRPHVLVSETMQQALAKEPQVAITRNLAPQLVPGGLLVPERIELHATLLDPRREFSIESEPLARKRVELGCVMTLDANGTSVGDVVWPSRVPQGMSLFIRTRIRVFDDLGLGDYDSGLTVPARFALQREPAGGQTIRFEYRTHPRPGLVATV